MRFTAAMWTGAVAEGPPDGRGPVVACGTDVWSVRVYALLSDSSSAIVNINSRVKLGSGVTLATCRAAVPPRLAPAEG